MSDSEIEARAVQYARLRKVKLADYFGGGTDGEVWKSDRRTAIKVMQRQKNYFMELGCYQRLRDRGISQLGQFAVPRLVDWDDDLLVVEMSTVTPPYLIDFGKAYLDGQPEHSPETLADYHEKQRDDWGDRYGDVQALLWRLEQLGIFYMDPKPGNIMFAD